MIVLADERMNFMNCADSQCNRSKNSWWSERNLLKSAIVESNARFFPDEVSDAHGAYQSKSTNCSNAWTNLLWIVSLRERPSVASRAFQVSARDRLAILTALTLCHQSFDWHPHSSLMSLVKVHGFAYSRKTKSLLIDFKSTVDLRPKCKKLRFQKISTKVSSSSED